VLLTGGQLTVPPGRNLTLRGVCGPANVSPCTLDANYASRHLHVTPGAQLYVSNVRLVNGSAAGAYTRSHFSSTCGPDDPTSAMQVSRRCSS